MFVNLDKGDLVALVESTDPSGSLFDNPLVVRSGRYVGGFYDRWRFDRGLLSGLSEEELWDLYRLCRD